MTRGKNIWLVPLLLALLVGGVGWWADVQLRRTIQQELRSDLQSALDANVTALEIWMANQKRIAAALAEEPRFGAVAVELLEHPVAGASNRLAVAEPAATAAGTHDGLSARQDLMTFAPDGARGVAAYVGGKKAASA